MSQASASCTHHEPLSEGSDYADSDSTHHREPSLSRCSSSSSIVSYAVKFDDCGQDESTEKNMEASDSLETAWTDSKHSSYLNFMEANFVKNLYGREYCAVDVCGQTPHQHTDFEDGDSAQSQYRIPFGTTELKMCDKGEWTWRLVSKSLVPACMPLALLTNPWVRHFRPKTSGTSGRNKEVEVQEHVTKTSPEAVVTNLEQQRLHSHQFASGSDPSSDNSGTKPTSYGRRIGDSEAGTSKQCIQLPSSHRASDAGLLKTRKRVSQLVFKQAPYARDTRQAMN